MSTYNGERFLEQQLQSIYAQHGVSVSLIVRDDGSSDGTKSILKREAASLRLEWYAGENVGPARSFMNLTDNAAGKAELYAYSDQDDVWAEDKLSSAAIKIGNTDGPALYICQTQLVDEELRPLPQKIVYPRLTFGEALICQYASGCTMVFNEPMRRLITAYKPKNLWMHDMWLVYVAFAVGAKVVFDPQPHIKYRQHRFNVVGETASFLQNVQKRVERVRRNRHIRFTTAVELLKGYGGQMTPGDLKLLSHIVNYRKSWYSKLWLVFCPKLWSSNKFISFTGRIAILTNRY